MANDPFWRIEEKPSFTLTSTDFEHEGRFAKPQYSAIFGVEGGEDRSPQLSWSGAPAETKSYAITCFDPDAPTQAGFWHWAVANIPASVTELPAGAGSADGALLPEGAYQLRTDAGLAQFIGSGSPPGHGPHRYYFVVHALGVEDIGVSPDATPTFFSFNLGAHVLARAVLIGIGER